MNNQEIRLKSLIKIPLVLLIWLVFFNNSLASSSPLENHPSLYLANHANDPIKWQLWKEETLKTAKQNNQLILVSSGYFSCHWCHVMQQENYQDIEVAQAVNQNYLAIKLDRELQTELDDYFIEFARKITGRAGWPLHIILTPDAKPLASFIYQPKEQLLATLEQMNNWWQENPEHLQKLANQAHSTLSPQGLSETHITKPIKLTQLKEEIYQELPNLIDDLSGGLNGTQKFPNSPLLLALLQQDDLPEHLAEWLELTLEQMQNQHLQDHIHGGFFRYTIDPEWQIPHYEKMLYDNAQLLEIYFLASQKFNNLEFLATANNTLKYIQTELISPTGLAYSSQSALDKNDQEGGRYLWTKQELKELLTQQEFTLIQENWNLEQEAILPTKINHSSWKNIQTKLSQEPAITDNKQLLGWNGLLLAGLAQAYKTTPTPETKSLGNKLANKLIELTQAPLSNGSSPRPNKIPKAINDKNEFIETASLADLSSIYRGLKCWSKATNHPLSKGAHRDLEALQNLKKQLAQLNPKQITNPDSATPTYKDPTTDFLLINQPAWRYASYLHECD